MSRPQRPLIATPSSISRRYRVWLGYPQHQPDQAADFSDEIKSVVSLPITVLASTKSLARQFALAEQTSTPLAIHLNPPTSSDQAYAPLVCTVPEAVDLAATTIIYSLYLGSPLESQMIAQLQQIKKQAQKKSLHTIVQVVFAQVSPEDITTNLLAYASQVVSQIAVDYAILPLPTDLQNLQRVAQAANPTHLIADLTNTPPADLIQTTQTVMSQGLAGIMTNQTATTLDTRATNRLSQLVLGM